VTNPTASDDFLVFKTPNTITITEVSAVCHDGTNYTYQLKECDGNGDNPVAINSAHTATTSDSNATISNAGVDASDYISLTSSAVTGATKVIVTVFYTID
jgi:hypothetical protein